MPPKKPAPPSTPHFTIQAGGILLVLFILGIIWTRLNQFYGVEDWGVFISNLFFAHVWPVIKIIAFVISAICLYGIIYNYRRLDALAKEEREMYSPKAMSPEGVVDQAKNERWERVIEQINSPNSGDWRLAIIEADIMLDELLTAAGYHGDSIGEKLKSVEQSDFTTLSFAWEAHKVRNEIAHRSDFQLTERDAKKTISQFETVFREFNII